MCKHIKNKFLLDVDECALGVDDCNGDDQICRNEIGTFSCIYIEKLSTQSPPWNIGN